MNSGLDLFRARFPSAWPQRIYMALILFVLLAAVGFGVRSLSKRYAGEVSVPGIYVRMRPEGGGMVEARALPARNHQAEGPRISMDMELVPVANLVRLIEEVSKARVAVPCPIAQRVSLRARDAPVGSVLKAVAAAANMTLAWRDGAFVLSSCGLDHG